MRILLAAKHAPNGPRPIGGVQSWCRTVADELNKRGHIAITWGPGQPDVMGGFDLGILANMGDTAPALDLCKKAMIICHGIIPAEKPPDATAIGTVVYTSEEVREHWNGNGPVIRQPIDTEFWSPSTWPLRVYITRFSYRRGLPFIPSIADAMSYEYRHIRNENQTMVRESLHQSACVLATGRAALEAMACDIPVVICDHRSAYQGPLMHLDIAESMTTNYSGRGGITPNVVNVSQAIATAMATDTKRDHILKQHNVSNIVDQLLEAA